MEKSKTQGKARCKGPPIVCANTDEMPTDRNPLPAAGESFSAYSFVVTKE